MKTSNLDKLGLPPSFKVKASINSHGCLIIKPVSGQWIRPLAECSDGSHEVFLQGDDVEYFISESVPFRYRTSLRDGYVVQFMMSSWNYRHSLGGQSD